MNNLRHNPYSWKCGKRLDGEEFFNGARCPICDQPFVINELGVL